MPTVHEIGRFRLDAGAGILFLSGEPVALGRRAVALLGVLVEQAGTPVSKDTLIAAAWPGLTVEESNLTVQMAALRRTLAKEPQGDRWIETLPRRGYRFVGPVTAVNTDSAVERKPPIQPNLPSIAVLPFENLSGDPDQDYFADGVVEEIITALSRFRQLFVIARNSSFTYKGRLVDIKQVGHELGVRYVLEGSIRRTTTRVRIAGQLVDAATGVHLWADRFDGGLEDIFDLQDQLTTNVVGAMTPKLEQAEIERARRKATESLDAYDLYLRGLACIHQATREANDEALRILTEAVRLDPEFASANGMAAWCYARRKLNGWVADREAEVAETARLARQATKLGKYDAVALAAGGYALLIVVGDIEDAAAFADRALLLNPNLPSAWLLSGCVSVGLGEPDAAIERMLHMIRLSPLDPFTFQSYSLIGMCHFLAERYDDASSWAENALRERPYWAPAARIAAAGHAMAGRHPHARRAMERIREIDPAMRVSQLGDLIPLLRRSEDLAKFQEGMRKAGLPE